MTVLKHTVKKGRKCDCSGFPSTRLRNRESIGCLKAAIHEEHQYFELTMSENGQDPFQMFKLSMGRKS